MCWTVFYRNAFGNIAIRWRTFLMHLKTLAMFSNGTKKRSVSFQKHLENIFEHWKWIKWNIINLLQRETFTKHSNIVNEWVTKTPNCKASPLSIIRQFRATVINKVIKRLKLHNVRNVWSEESIICSIFSLQVCVNKEGKREGN